MSNRPLNIMLIDDDLDTQRIFTMVVGHHEHNITVAEDGGQAMDLLKQNQPDVIVIDLFLPGMDGYKIFDRIRRDGLAPHSQMVATTAYHSVGTQENVLAHGFSGFLAKPFKSAELVPFLESIAGN